LLLYSIALRTFLLSDPRTSLYTDTGSYEGFLFLQAHLKVVHVILTLR